ncbi:hypothetical protein JW926_17785 [Candidatus Sumerlaeota bacterium]|nr:hypothetical protein [Candidatus Sumerlaeota bacterium]
MNDHSIIPILLFFCLNVSAFVGWGVFVLQISGIAKEMPDFPHILFYSGIMGIIVLGDIMLISGLLGYLGSGILFFLFLLGVILGVFSINLSRRKSCNVCKENPAENKGKNSFSPLWIILCLPFIILIFMHSLVPDISGDAYLYHITVPRYYSLEGGIEPVRISFCYNYPMQIEMFYLAALRWGHEQSGVMMNFAILGLSCLGIILLSRRLGSNFTGVFTVYLFLSLPIVMRWAPTSLVDLAAAPFLLGSFLAMITWRNNKRRIWLYLAGFCAGGAVAVKIFLGIASFIIMPIILIFSCIIQDDNKRSARFPFIQFPFKPGSPGDLLHIAGSLVAYFSGVAFPLLPWVIKNAFMTNNPFFPFALSLFPTRADLIPSALLLHAMHGIPEYKGILHLLQSAWGSFSLLSWDGNWIIILVMVLSPFSLGLSMKRRRRRLFWGFMNMILLVFLYYGVNAQARWFQGYFPFLLIAFAMMAEDLIKRLPSKRKWILMIMILFTLANAGWNYYQRFRETYLFPWTGLKRQWVKMYLRDKDRTPEALFLNSNLPENSKVLLFDPEIASTGRWMERRFYQAGDALFQYWESNQADISTALQELQNMKITHIALYRSVSMRNPILTQLTQGYLEERATSPYYTLYELKYP